MHYGREVKQGTFPTALLAVWRFAKCAPIWSKISTSNTFSKHESSTANRQPQSEDVYQHWSIFNIPIDLLKSTSLALMSLEIQNLRLSPGIIVVKPRFKAPNSQTNAPSSSLSLVSPTFTLARLGVGGHLGCLFAKSWYWLCMSWKECMLIQEVNGVFSMISFRLQTIL